VPDSLGVDFGREKKLQVRHLIFFRLELHLLIKARFDPHPAARELAENKPLKRTINRR